MKTNTYLKALVLMLALAAAAMAATIHQVTVNTSSLTAGTAGFLDIQFNGAGNPTPSGSAGLSGFAATNFSVDDGSGVLFGDASGALVPGPLTIGNTGAANGYFVPFLVGGAGSGFSFVLTLTGNILAPPPGNLNGTDFGLLIYAADGVTPLLTADGQLVRVAVGALGAVSPNAFGPAGVLQMIPEPATALLVAAGLVLAARASRSSRR
jgi:hypothetical protein